jgi:hypothetical protein
MDGATERQNGVGEAGEEAREEDLKTLEDWKG